MEWVSVKDKRPNARKKYSAVIACLSFGQRDIIYWCKKEKCWKDYFYKKDVTNEIQLWMPLPQLPKEK